MSDDRERGGAADAVPPPAGETNTKATASRLREAFEREVDAIGQAWAEARIDALRKEGRSIAGGWPGTMSEARARVSASARARASDSDREAMARRAYVVAKARWLSRTLPDGDD